MNVVSVSVTKQKSCANENLGRRRGWNSRQNTGHRREAKTGNRLRAQNDSTADGLPREEACAGLGVRRSICRLSRTGSFHAVTGNFSTLTPSDEVSAV